MNSIIQFNSIDNFKISFIIYLIIFSITINYKINPFIKNHFFNYKFIPIFSKKINELFVKNNFVNLNQIESLINKNRPWSINIDKKNEINLGFHIDKSYVLRCMMTLTSIMDSQKKETKIRFHIAVVDVDAINMIKIYSLRYRNKRRC